MQPLVSVVMANYNGGKYLPRTIESVLDQSYQNLEFIMVDDCSTDNSREVMEYYEKKDSRVRTLFLEKNSQVCVATNRGLEMIQGTYLARIDSDDVWRPGKLEKQMTYLQEHPECGCCFTLVDVIDENDQDANAKQPELFRLFDERNKSQEEWIRSLFFKGNSLCHASSVMPVSTFRAVGNYHPAYLQLQDYHMWVKIAAKFPIYVMQERLVEYRREGANSGSLSTMGAIKEVRRFNEDTLIHDHYFENMDLETFARAFAPCFKNKDAKTKEELLIEQAYIKCTPLFGANGNAWPGIAAFEKLLENPETQRVLEEKYGFTAKSYYDISRQYILENPFLEQYIPKKYKNEITVFFDRGENYNSGDIVRKSYEAENGKIRETICFNNENVKSLRVDLLEGDISIMENVKFILNGFEILPHAANGSVEGGRIVFETTDPVFVFPYEEKYGTEIVIEADLIAAGSSIFGDLLTKIIHSDRAFRAEKASLTAELDASRSVVSEKEAEISVLKQELESLQKALETKTKEFAHSEEMLTAIAVEAALLKESMKTRG